MAYSKEYPLPDYPQITFGDGELTYDEQLDMDLKEIRQEIERLSRDLETMQKEHIALTGVRHYKG